MQLTMLDPTTTWLRGDEELAPDSIGHMLMLSGCGRWASAAFLSVISSTPAKCAHVANQSHPVIRPEMTVPRTASGRKPPPTCTV